MAKNHKGDIPSNIRAFIRIHVSSLYKKQLFKYHERDDLIQDLVLFYIEKFYRSRTNVPDDLVFIALKRQAAHILRSRLRQVQSGAFFSSSLNCMQEDCGTEAVDNFCLEDLEQQITIAEVLRKLTPKERELLTLILSGVSVEEARRQCHVRNDFYAKLCIKLAEEFKK